MADDIEDDVEDADEAKGKEKVPKVTNSDNDVFLKAAKRYEQRYSPPQRSDDWEADLVKDEEVSFREDGAYILPSISSLEMQ